MRTIHQPGPPVEERIQWVEARGRGFSFTLQAGVPLLEAARRGFAEACARLILHRDEAAQLGRTGRAHVTQHFSRTAFGSHVEAILDKLLT
jgi:hypothetical protein